MIRLKVDASCLVRLEGSSLPVRVCCIIVRIVVARLVQVVASVCEECFVIQVVGVIRGESTSHAALLIEETLIIHCLP